MSSKQRFLLAELLLLLAALGIFFWKFYTPPVENPLPVLMYHHLVEDGQECNDMTVTVGRMDKDLQWLADHGYTTILPADLLSGEPLLEKPVLITFDDGYRSNYDLLFPLLEQHQAKAAIALIAGMQDNKWVDQQFLRWEECREMAASGLVEFGSHTYLLHNMDEREGRFEQGGVNGIQRDPAESDAEFADRVLADIQLSHDRIEEELDTQLNFFAYPYGLVEPDAEELIHNLFPITFVTLEGIHSLDDGLREIHRETITMKTPLWRILP